MIFPVAECERLVQIGDKTRLSGVKSFVGKGETPIDKVEIAPDFTEDDPTFINVSGQGERDWFLDWIYDGLSRTVVIAVKVSCGSLSSTATKSIDLLTSAEDILFSSDDDLNALEPDLLKYAPDGRATFINIHREAKYKILEALSDRGIANQDGSPLTASVLKNVSEVRTWSRDLTLALIFQGMSNASDDVFQAKAKYYSGLADTRAGRAYLTLSIPVKGSNDPVRAGQVQSARLIR